MTLLLRILLAPTALLVDTLYGRPEPDQMYCPTTPCPKCGE